MGIIKSNLCIKKETEITICICIYVHSDAYTFKSDASNKRLNYFKKQDSEICLPLSLSHPNKQNKTFLKDSRKFQKFCDFQIDLNPSQYLFWQKTYVLREFMSTLRGGGKLQIRLYFKHIVMNF